MFLHSIVRMNCGKTVQMKQSGPGFAKVFVTLYALDRDLSASAKPLPIQFVTQNSLQTDETKIKRVFL